MKKENQVSLHRVMAAKADKLYRAFSNPVAMAHWLPPYGFLCTVQQMEFKVSGRIQMTFINFSTGHEHSFGGYFTELIPNKRIQYKERFDDPNMPGEMTTTIDFTQGAFGTEMSIVQENLPEQIPAEMCYLGWQESLEKFKRLVEPEIPDA